MRKTDRSVRRTPSPAAPPSQQGRLWISLTRANFEIFTIRPHFQDTGRIIESPVAKATYVANKKIWKIFWMMSDLKWHSYLPDPEVSKFEEFLAIVQIDEHNCFFG